ncbi:DUF481 domain-containing protein [Parapedomonas caeni]|jgi:putative salt-induced outer membrane protein
MRRVTPGPHLFQSLCGTGIAASLVAAICTTPAHADPLPEPVAAMIRAASGDAAKLDVVTSVARATNPRSLAEIDTLVASLAGVRAQSTPVVVATADEAPQAPEPAPDRGWLADWTGTLEAGASRSTGNSKDVGLLLKGTASRESDRWRHKLNALLDRKKSDGELTRARTLADLQFDYKFDGPLSLYGLVGWERDRFAGYSRRFTESVGVGYRPLDRETMTLNLTAGPAFRQIRFVDGSRENEIAGRGALSYRWQIHPAVEFAQVAALVLDGSNTYTATSSLTSKLIGAVSARLSYDVIHESDPIADLARTDTTTRFSVVYNY